ncbi:MAG: hypothetical protein WC315_00235 [Candidatus Omnitrophota bacterium]|jgi:chromosome segregation ATPase
MRKILYPVLAVLALAVIVVDHYTVNTYLSEFEEARNYNTAEMVQAFQMQDTVLFAQGLQETLMITSRRLEKTENQVIECVKYIQQLRETIMQQETAVLSASATIKELTDDNAKLQKSLDECSSQLELKRRELERVKKELEDLKDTTKDLKKAKKDLEATNKTLVDGINWIRAEYERITGTPAPLPPDTLR